MNNQIMTIDQLTYQPGFQILGLTDTGSRDAQQDLDMREGDIALGEEDRIDALLFDWPGRRVLL